MAERTGKIFETGFPYLSRRGIVYDWPDKREERRKELIKRREELAEYLLPRLKKYLEEWEVSGLHPSYPYIQLGEKAVIFHFGGNGRWIEIDFNMLEGFSAFHNLDSWKEGIPGFNLSSDTVEFFDEKIKCPRIKKLIDKIKIEYFLPDGETNLPLDSVPGLIDKNIYEWFFQVGKLKDIELEIGEKHIEYRFSGGKIKTENGVCNGEIENGWNIFGTTFVMAKLLDSFHFGKNKKSF